MLSAKDFVAAQLYASEDEVIQDALAHLLDARPELRLELAIYRYRVEALSLSMAAELAGVSPDRLRESLLERGIQPRLGPETLDEARREVDALARYLRTST